MKILIISVASVLVVAAAGVGITAKVRSTLAAAQPPASVRVEPAVRGELTELVTAPGEIQPRTKVSISAKVAATIVKLPFDEGAVVTRGKAEDGSDASMLVELEAKDLLALKHSAEAREAAQKAQIQVARSHIDASESMIQSQRVALIDAKRDMDRQLGLLKTKDVPQSTVDTAQTKYDTLAAQLESAVHSKKSDEANLTVMQHQLEGAQADVEKANEDVGYATIRSPIDGVVTKRKAEVGDMAMIGTMNNAGTVILEVADLDQMMMFARIDEVSIGSVKVGQHAIVRVQAFPDEAFDGIVETVALARNDDQSAARNAAEGSTRFFEAKIKLDTKGRRIPSGLAADADIETKKHSGIKVPSQSVLGRPIESLSADLRAKPEVDPNKSITPVVYRLIDGKAVTTPVKVGPSDETHTLILAGLKEGDPIIAGPFKVLETLADAQAVKAEAGPTTHPSTQPAATPKH